MKPEITTGNAAVDGGDFGGWFVGDLNTWQVTASPLYSALNFGLRDNHAIEIKWGVHSKGTTRPDGWASTSPFVTLSLLVHGAFNLDFRSSGEKLPAQRCQLRTAGDYAIWGQDCEHTWEAIEDSVILTVRWRSSGQFGG